MTARRSEMSLLRRSALMSAGQDLFLGLGAVATLIALVQVLAPGFRWAVAWVAFGGVIVALGVTLVRQLPRSELVATYPGGPWTITVSEGDVLEFDPAIVTVDRSLSMARADVGGASLVSQLVDREFAGIPDLLEERLGPLVATARTAPLDGGVLVDVVDHSPTRYLLTCSRKEADGSQVTYGELWRVFEGAWTEIRRRALTSVAMPLVGTGFSRTALPDVAVLMTMLASLHGAAIERPVCADVRVVVPRGRLSAIGAHHVRSMLEGLGYSVSTTLWRAVPAARRSPPPAPGS